MRESRPYGSVRGARDETRVPTATPPRVLIARRDVRFFGRPRDRRLPREVLRLHQMIASSGSEWAQQTTAAFAEAAAREFESSVLEDVPASLDLEWLRACVDYLAQRDA
jgi:hypothetical protein